MPRVHAFRDDALGDDDAVGLKQRLDAGEVTAAELTDAAIARIASVDGSLAAMEIDRYDQAQQSAVANAASGPFAGIPTLLKDNVDIAGLPTQNGSRAYRAHPAKVDGIIAECFAGLGFNVLGKTRMSEFGFNASAEPPVGEPVRNPWDTSHTSGASSAGTAALVAAGAVPLAHGNDGGGSIRIPAACTGLVGLKPSRGRGPLEKSFSSMPVQIVADGVLTRSMRDTAAFIDHADRAYRNLSTPPIGAVQGPGQRRLRIGLLDRSPSRGIDADTARVLAETAALLEEMGHQVEPTAPPVDETFEADFLTYWGLLAFLECTLGKAILDRSFRAKATERFTQDMARRCRAQLPKVLGAVRRLRRAEATVAANSRDFDVLLSPVLAHATPLIGTLNTGDPLDELLERLLAWVAFTPLANASGQPSLSLPLGAATDGTPIGIMLTAKNGHERRLLELGFELEEARPFRKIHRT